MNPFSISFVGDSGVGKTTLLVRIVQFLRAEGVDAAVLKHSKQFDDPDPPAKDSARLRAAGAQRVLLCSPERTILFWDHPGGEPDFAARQQLVSNCELLLVESYRSAGLPAVEVMREALPRRIPRLTGDPMWRALVSDFTPDGLPPAVARFSLEDAQAIARWVLTIRDDTIPSKKLA
ncbi:MAG: molybdopterin-guanine dinucleotide biosynthesis protein B [Planctomycetota bacterium]